MRDNYKDQSRSNPDNPDWSHGNPDGNRPRQGVEWSRLEEIGDLHFHASAYSTALDYYGQLINEGVLSVMDREQAVQVLRKAVDSNILSPALPPFRIPRKSPSIGLFFKHAAPLLCVSGAGSMMPLIWRNGLFRFWP